jgi:5S rRNA maturation endonuclease (ribonuclease M5)
MIQEQEKKEKTIEIKQEYILIVEGKNDELFFKALCEKIGINNIQIISLSGKDNLESKLKAIKNTSGFPTVKSIGIIMDADDNPTSTFQKIQNALRQIGLPAPQNPFQFNNKGKIKVGIAIIPDENTAGELEDLCIKVIENDPAFCCVEKYIECLNQKGLGPKKLSKSKIYAYLSSKETPEIRLGEAAQRGYLDLDHKALDKIKDFIESLLK